MKKLYTLAFAAAVAVSASATVNFTKVGNAQIADVDSKIAFRSAAAVSENEVRVCDAPDYETLTWKSLGQGKYVSSVVAATYGSTTEAVDVDVYEAEEYPGVYKAVGVWPDMVNSAELIVDASNPDFVIVPKQFTGIKDDVDGDTYIASRTWVFTVEQGFSSAEVIAGVSSIVPLLGEGVINFPANSLVLNWPDAPEDSKYQTDPTAWYGSDKAGSLVLPGAEYVEPWQFYGKGVMSGDFFCAGFGITMKDYDVNVYVSTADENIFRVDDAISALYKGLSISTTSPSVELDATDPGNVMMPLTSTGINGSTDGVYYMCTYNLNYDDIDKCPEQNRVSFVVDGNTATFTFPYPSLWLYAYKSGNLYYGNSVLTTLVIERDNSGVDGIISADDENAPAEYYNLQGMRVAEPANGLFIVRQGNKVSKVVK